MIFPRYNKEYEHSETIRFGTVIALASIKLFCERDKDLSLMRYTILTQKSLIYYIIVPTWRWRGLKRVPRSDLD